MRKQRILPFLACVFAFWLAISVIFTSQMALDQLLMGKPIEFFSHWFRQLPRWMSWAVLTIGITWLALRVPITSLPRKRAILVHGAAFLAVHVSATTFWLLQVSRMPENKSYKLTDTFAILFVASFHFSVMTYAAVNGAILAIGSARLERQLSEARLLAIRRQLQPHFFFNTLHSISGLVRAQRNKEAVDMIAGLGDLVRESMDEDPRPEAPLARELELIDRYLAIQKVRFGDRLETRVDVPAEALAALVPVLLLQPIVENALDHGLAPRADGGWVEIIGRHQGENLELTVRNNGVPFPADWQPGVGLRNTKDRLRQLYGERAELSIDNDPPRVQITLPWRTS